jgi:transposase InsO family protein
MVQSMSRTGNCWDNAAMESFFKTLKIERVHRTRYETRAQAKLDIVQSAISDFGFEVQDSSNLEIPLSGGLCVTF